MEMSGLSSGSSVLRTDPSGCNKVDPANGIIRSTRRRGRSGTQHLLEDVAIELMRSGETMQRVLAHTPANDAQRTARREIVTALRNALDARRQRIIVSQSNVGSVKWVGLLLQALVTLIAIAMVHRDIRLTCAIAMTLFSTAIALSVFMIASYNRPFTGKISVGPELLQQVISREVKAASDH